jgi:hypothetical protein
MNTSIQTTGAILAAMVAAHMVAFAAAGTALQSRAESAMLPVVKAASKSVA